MNPVERHAIVLRIIELYGEQWVFQDGKLFHRELPPESLEEINQLKSVIREEGIDFFFFEKPAQECGIEPILEIPKIKLPLDAETLGAQKKHNNLDKHEYIRKSSEMSLQKPHTKKFQRSRARMPPAHA